MKRSRRRGFWMAALLAAGAVAAAGQGLPAVTPATAAVAPAPTISPSGVIQAFGAAGPDDKIGPGDLLDVRVFDQAQLSGTARVGESGELDLPFVGEFPAAGLTPAQLEAKLAARYGEFLRHPLVSVRVLEVNSRQVSVTGEVIRPGVYAFSGQLRLLQALAMAGGVATDRAGTVLYLLHGSAATTQAAQAGRPVTISVTSALETLDLHEVLTDPRMDPMLHSGDMIEVPEAQQVFVTGDVVKSGALPLKPGLNLADAVSLAGGPLSKADPHHVRIIRRVPGRTQPEVLIFDLAKIHHGQGLDPKLEADDICVVPESGWRDVGLGILDFFAGAGRWRVQSEAGVY